MNQLKIGEPHRTRRIQTVPIVVLWQHLEAKPRTGPTVEPAPCRPSAAFPPSPAARSRGSPAEPPLHNAPPLAPACSPAIAPSLPSEGERGSAGRSPRPCPRSEGGHKPHAPPAAPLPPAATWRAAAAVQGAVEAGRGAQHRRAGSLGAERCPPPGPAGSGRPAAVSGGAAIFPPRHSNGGLCPQRRQRAAP